MFIILISFIINIYNNFLISIFKVKARSPVFSDKEFSTVYMDLPDLKDAKHNQKSLSSSSSSSSLNTDDEEILKKLLEVDLNLAKKLRNINRPKGKFRSIKAIF